MIIFINGSINAGKSTIAKLLVKELPNTALLEIDTLREMIEWMPIDQAIPINLENATALIRNFANRNLNVIVPYPLSQENYDYIRGEIENTNAKIFVFTLAPQLENALSNRGTRELDEWEKTRIQHHYNIGIHSPLFGEIIDNSHQTPEETKKCIVEKINIDKVS